MSKKAKRNQRKAEVRNMERELHTPPPVLEEEVVHEEDILLSEEDELSIDIGDIDMEQVLAEDPVINIRPPEGEVSKQVGKDPVQQNGTTRSTPPEEKQDFIDQMMAIDGPTSPQQKRKRDEPPSDLREKISTKGSKEGKGKSSVKKRGRAEAPTYAEAAMAQPGPSGLAHPSRPGLSSTLVGPNGTSSVNQSDLLTMANYEVISQQVFPLLKAYLTSSAVPKNPREAAMKGLWETARPRIYSVMFVVSYNRDPVPSYSRACEVVLYNQRSLETVIHRLGENSQVILDFVYGLHAQRVLLTPATAKHMLVQKNVLSKEGSFYHIFYSSTDDKIMGREEALITPQLIDLRRKGKLGFMVRVNIKLYGRSLHHGPNKIQASDYEVPVQNLQWEVDQHEKYVQRLKVLLNH